jgi:hypothetical protein
VFTVESAKALTTGMHALTAAWFTLVLDQISHTLTLYTVRKK